MSLSPGNEGLNLTFAGKNYQLGEKPFELSLADSPFGESDFHRLDSTTEFISKNEYHDRLVCLPNVEGGLYQWGFSRMLTALVVIFQIVWAVSMYFAWLDAMLSSRVVKSGFTTTQLKGALSVSAAAEDRLGVKAKYLITKDRSWVAREMEAKDSTIGVELLTASALKDWELETHPASAAEENESRRRGVYTATCSKAPQSALGLVAANLTTTLWARTCGHYRRSWQPDDPTLPPSPYPCLARRRD